MIAEFDVHLFHEGKHWAIYDKLGAHVLNLEGTWGTHFAVWAPNARRVSVVGDFNQWNGRIHTMRRLFSSGIWEIFLPDVREGAYYKFEIVDAKGNSFFKTDPFAFFAQHTIETACIVYDLSRFQWSDQAWIQARKQGNVYSSPMSIYEVHLGSWQRVQKEKNRPCSYLELSKRLIPYVKEMGFTHIELMPVMEHPFDGSWGYQVVNYYAPTSRFGPPDEFRHFINQCHLENIGVILDWVPGHFPKDVHGLARYDGTCLYEYEDARLGEHVDWGTLVFNYARNEVRNFLIGNALFWLREYHIDGLRVDAVASMLYLDYSRPPGKWIPNQFGGHENLDAVQFLQQCNTVCYKYHLGVFLVAEESTSWPGVSHPVDCGGLGFGFKWNMGWMNDSLRYIARNPIDRKFHQGEITFSLWYAFRENFILVLSHDEVVHGKGSLLTRMPGDVWQKFANLRLLLAWMWAHPGKKLLFQGGEFGQWEEWKHNQELDWQLLSSPMHSGLKRLVQQLNLLYRGEPSLHELDSSSAGFEWIDFQDSESSIWSFLRKSSNGAAILFLFNATPAVRRNYRLGVSVPGFYQEILNTDADAYGGSNIDNQGGVWTENNPCGARPHSLRVELSPLSAIAFRVPAQHEAQYSKTPLK